MEQRHIKQIIVIVANAIDATSKWAEYFGLCDWRIEKHFSNTQKYVTAIHVIGNREIVLLEPISGLQCFSEFLNQFKEGYWGIVEEVEDAESQAASFELEGYQRADQLLIGKRKLICFDTRKKLGLNISFVDTQDALCPNQENISIEDIHYTESVRSIKNPDERIICQIGIMVSNLQETLDNWVNTYLKGPWKVLTHSDKLFSGIVRKNGFIDQHFEYQICMAMLGDIQIEIMMPVYGIPGYDRFMAHKNGAMHHMKEKLKNDELVEVICEYAYSEMNVLFGAHYFNANFYYPETQNKLGVQIELGNGEVANSPVVLGYMYPKE